MPRLAVRPVALTALVVALIVAPIGPSEATSGEAQQLLSLLNGARASSGLPPVALDADLNRIAQAHAQRMAGSGRIFHNSSYPSSAGSWSAYGENVGSGPSVDAVHRAVMSSASHRRNIFQRAFNIVGIGVARWSGGIMVVEDFLARGGPAKGLVRKAAAPAPETPPAPPPPPPPPSEIGMWVPIGLFDQIELLNQLDSKMESLSVIHKQLAAAAWTLLSCRYDSVAPGASPGTMMVFTVCRVQPTAQELIPHPVEPD